MSTIERVNKQIKALAANSKFLTTIINENKIAQIQKSVDLLKSTDSSDTRDVYTINQRSNLVYSEKEICFDSMLQLTNFILYNDYPNETDYISKRKYLQTSRCEFNMSKADLKEIDSFAKELDTIEDELAEIHEHLNLYKKSYVIYCENLMRFIDQKEVLMNMFLNYYDEYFLRNKYVKPVKKSRRTSDSVYMYQEPAIIGRKERRSSNRKNSVCSNHSNHSNQSNRYHVKKKTDGYISDDSCFSTFQAPGKLKSAKSSTIYVSSIPTENRFAILARNHLNKKTKS